MQFEREMDHEQFRKLFYEFFQGYKKSEIKKSKEKGYLEIAHDEIVSFDPKAFEYIMKKPEEGFAIMERVLQDVEQDIDLHMRVNITTMPEEECLFIRDIRSAHIGKLIMLEGVVSRKSDVRPKLQRTDYLCSNPDCKYSKARLSIKQDEFKVKQVKACPACRAVMHEVDQLLVDAQNLVLEEIVEQLGTGDQPKRVNVLLKEHLVSPLKDRKTNPGSKVYVVGIVKNIPIQTRTGAQTVNYDIIIEANYISGLEEDFSDVNIEEKDLKEIRELANDPQVYDILVRNLAPSIFGHQKIKEALLTQLFGGRRFSKGDGTKKRGDIHILLIGDPGAAKSQLMKSIRTIAPKSTMVSGKSASSAGLTAAVVRDEVIKGWALEAGALVLANGGLCIIDELDKMSKDDSSAMHEALEQQTISIAKANIRATLLSQTAVLAAANPKLGRFDPFSDLSKQIDMPPSLLNRFDLIFAIQDIPDKKKDALIASHILESLKDIQETSRDLDETFLKKYISYARHAIQPELSEEAIKLIGTFYVNLRSSGDDDEEIKSIPISARQLEAILRLAEAYARIQLNQTITVEHAQRAIDLMMYALERIGIDPKTGKMDIDRIATGITASTRSHYKTILHIIEAIQENEGEAHLEKIEQEAEKKKITRSELKEILEKLKQEGTIFEPRKQVYKMIL